MPDTSERRRNVVTLLEDVLTGTLASQKALEQWPNIDAETDRTIKNAWHALYHFMKDEDIHQREPAYKRKQIQTLREFINTLEKQ